MLKKIIISHLAILFFMVFSNLSYSNSIDDEKIAGKADPSIAKLATVIHVNEFSGVSYYAELPSPETDPYFMYSSFAQSYREDSGVERAEAVVPDFVIYRNYVRPSDRETAEEFNYLRPMTTPYISTNTSIGVAPYGFNYYTEKPPNYHPIRDYRADYWKNKYYRDGNGKNLAKYDVYLNLDSYIRAASEEE